MDYYGRGAQDGHLDFHTAPSVLLGDATRLNNGGQNFALPETAGDGTLTRRTNHGWFVPSTGTSGTWTHFHRL